MAIDRDFLLAFGRDVDFHDPIPQSTYLDRLTGDILEKMAEEFLRENDIVPEWR